MKRTKILALLSVTVLLFTVASSAASLSPAIDIIRNKTTVVKTGTVNSEVTFSPEDFEKALNIKKCNRITILSLPPSEDGTLKIGGLDMLEGQTVSRNNISMMRFLPSSNDIIETSFTFKLSDSTDTFGNLCKISLTDGVNITPIAEDDTVKTYKNITVFGTLPGSDADGDKLTYEILEAPGDGILTLLDSTRGKFMYTPIGDFTGKDRFEYCVKDEYGNVSESAVVKLKVDKPYKNIFFSDMKGHWAHVSAINMVRAGIMNVEVNSDSKPVFNPDKELTRSEFLVMAMKLFGDKIDVDAISYTEFSDDYAIPTDMKGFISAAYDNGIIRGYTTESGVYFMPEEKITRAEAAVILTRLIDVPDTNEVSRTVFSDKGAVPSWAQLGMQALVSCGILKGTDDGYLMPGAVITRSQAAELFCSAQKRMESWD